MRGVARAGLGTMVLVVGLLGCGERGGNVAAPLVHAALAKGGGGGGSPVVSATDPSSAPQDVRLNVRVLGSGFDVGSSVRFLLKGKAVASVTVHSTVFIGGAELVSDVSIAADAAPDLYDVEVTTSGGKKGIGVETFQVTGPTLALAPAASGAPHGLYGDASGLYPGAFATNSPRNGQSTGNFNMKPWCADGRRVDARLPWSVTGTVPDCDGAATHVMVHLPGLLLANGSCAGGCPLGAPGPAGSNFAATVNYYFNVDTNGDGRYGGAKDKAYNVVWTDARYDVLRRAAGTPCTWRVTAGVADLWELDTLRSAAGTVALDVVVTREDGVCAL